MMGRTELQACATTMRVDFTSQAFFRDPAAGIERLRASGPVLETWFPIVGKVWVTTTYDSTARVLKDSATFTLRKEGGGLAGLRWWMPAFIGALANSMLTMDEPDHTRLRGIVDEAFRRRAILDMEPRIRAIADDLAGRLFADGSPADLVERYARMLPLSVICELLGLPPSDRPKFIAWANRVARVTSVIGFLRMMRGLAQMKCYLEERLRFAREHGGDGLIAELVRVEMEGGRISADEMVSMVLLLLGAGSETTTHLISGSVYELLKNPTLRDWLEEDWSRAGLAVEEFLRFEPAPLLRHRDPFLPWSSACTHRRHVRPASAVHALAKAPAGGRARANPLAQAARPQVDRTTARRGRPLMAPCGTLPA
jgi:cytochrome P450